jgi:simple sugar transport system substrate-binding protein
MAKMSLAVTIAAVIIVAIIAGFAGYYLAPTGVTTVTQAVTVTGAPAERRVKAAWIYVGPIGDYGWTYAHHQGLLYAQSVLPWLDPIWYESVKEGEESRYIDEAISQGAEVIFTTSFGFMEGTYAKAQQYPNIWFWHCSGYKRRENMGTYFAELYQTYYLMGIAGAAVTETRKFGYVAAYPIPEVIRHINAWVLGIRDGLRLRDGYTPDTLEWDQYQPEFEVYVEWLFSWFDPEKARTSARSLVETKNVDVLAYTEDTPTVLIVADEYMAQGKKVYSYSHYSPMKQYSEHGAYLTGGIVDWGPIYVYILAKYYAGAAESEDIWTRIGDLTPVRWAKISTDGDGHHLTGESTLGQKEGTVFMEELNTEAIPQEFLDFMKLRYEEMKEGLFDPFTGPIYDQDGNLRAPLGVRLSHDDLWSMNYFVQGVVSRIPAG